ncbi:hypothetical protein V8D89_008508 [Ganoderma adspersum]
MTPVCRLTSDQLPVELLMEALRNISHPRTLAYIMQVNRHLCAIVEEQLYHTVSLTGQVHFSKLRLSLMSCPRRAPFVQDIRLLDLQAKNCPVPNILPSFLASLRNLRKLELAQALTFTSETPYCDALSSLRFSHLRSLQIKVDLHPHRFLDFLAAHADRLEELKTTSTYLFKESPVADLLATIKLPALPVLECDTLFLGGHERIPVPPNLTHLSRPQFCSWELPLFAKRVGTQLVSLKLSIIFLDDVLGRPSCATCRSKRAA